VFDEVVSRPGADGYGVPAAAGIPLRAAEQLLILPYGTPESLERLRREASTLAGIIVEPVQSRRPDLQPKEFLVALRGIADEAGIPLIFDEVITGFRSHVRGAQGHFGVTADVAAYGKVVGGGMPVGVLAGRGAYMDALDGGRWRFGDASAPVCEVTYFAGTFVRHPLALAAVCAVLTRMRDEGEAIITTVNARTAKLVADLSQVIEACGAPIRITSFSSMFRVALDAPEEVQELFGAWLRSKGIFIASFRTNFLTEAHGAEECAEIVHGFHATIREMQGAGLIPVNRTSSNF
jgi:glutamate-1-semialdehyde aminotransferase